MIFRYFQYREPNGHLIRLPLLPVRLTRKQKHVDVFALVDSGSDSSLFPFSVAQILGIDIMSGTQDNVRGVDNLPIDVYYHQVHFEVMGLSSVDITVGFTDSPGIGSGLLGQRGFFENYHVRFERYKDKLEIYPKSTTF